MLQELLSLTCQNKTTLLSASEIQKYLPILPLWQIKENCLIYQFSHKDYSHLLDLTQQIGQLAIRLNHHPDIVLYYGKVIIKLTTHSVGGLSINDFIFAAHCQALWTKK